MRGVVSFGALSRSVTKTPPFGALSRSWQKHPSPPPTHTHTRTLPRHPREVILLCFTDSHMIQFKIKHYIRKQYCITFSWPSNLVTKGLTLNITFSPRWLQFYGPWVDDREGWSEWWHYNPPSWRQHPRSVCSPEHWPAFSWASCFQCSRRQLVHCCRLAKRHPQFSWAKSARLSHVTSKCCIP